jgi:putative endonuclease
MCKDAHKDGSLQSQIGRAGEALAAQYLRRNRGFDVIACNWHNPRDRREEIDLIALNAGATVFVEVKTRGAGNLVPGYFAVGRRKRKALRGAIRAFLGMQFPPLRTYRLDVIEVELGDGPPKIRHFENVGLFR